MCIVNNSMIIEDTVEQSKLYCVFQIAYGQVSKEQSKTKSQSKAVAEAGGSTAHWAQSSAISDCINRLQGIFIILSYYL